MTRYAKKRARVAKLAAFERPEANAKRVVKNTLVLYMRMMVVMLVGLYTGRVFLQALGVNDYGLQNVAGAVISMFTFLNGSLATASSRFLTVEMGQGTPGSLKRVFSTVLTVHFILACVFVVLLETAGVMVLETKLNIEPSRIFAVKWIYHCSVISVFFSITQVPYGAVVVAHERMSAFAWMAIYDVVVKLGIAFSLLYYSGDKLILNGTLWLISGLTTMMIYRVYCIRNFTEARYRRVFDRKLLKPIFAFAGWQVAAQTSQMLAGAGVVMLNQRYFGPAVVAAVTIAQTVNGHIVSFIGNFRSAANPQIVKLYAAEKYEESKRLLIQTTHFCAYLLLVLGVPVWIYSDEALTIWLGANVPKFSPQMVKFILLGSFFSIFDTALYSPLYASGRLAGNALFNIFNGCLVFGSTWALIVFTRNPLVSVTIYAFKYVLLGMVYKPILVRRVAGYRLKDFVSLYLPCFKALSITGLIGFGIKVIMPTSTYMAIPSCALMAFLNIVAIFFFVATSEQRQMVCKLLSRVPRIGPVLVRGILKSSWL